MSTPLRASQLPGIRQTCSGIACLMLAAGPGAAQSAEQGRAAAASVDYVRESWTVQDGLPVNSVNDLLQSRDGYLWIATFDGLVRFDGVRFTVFNSGNSSGLPSNRIVALYETRDGSLWLRTEQYDLVRLRDGEFTPFDTTRGVSGDVHTLYEDDTAVLWLGMSTGLGRIEGERVATVAGDVIRSGVTNVLGRRDGSLWAGTPDAGTFAVTGGRARHIDRIAGGTTALYEDDAGTLWIGTATGIWSERGGSISAGPPIVHVLRFVQSRLSGALWAQAPSGLFRMAGGVVDEVDADVRVLPNGVLWVDTAGAVWHASGPNLHRDGSRVHALPARVGQPLPPTTITSAVRDAEGSIWLGTHAGGLHRLTPTLFTTFSETEGLAYSNVYSVYQDRSGFVWAGTWGGGLSRIDPRSWAMTTFGLAQGFPENVTTIIEEEAGGLRVGAFNGLFLCAPGAGCREDAPPGAAGTMVLAVDVDAEGALWAGTAAGLFRRDADVWTELSSVPGAPAAHVRAFARTADGALWMGTNGSGLARYHAGRFTSVRISDGLPADLVRSLYVDADGWLWVGTEGRGLARVDPRGWGATVDAARQRIVTYDVAHGLFDDVIHQILEDDAARLWMSTNRGIFWVRRAELNAFADGTQRSVRSTAYTERDGLRNREANGGVQPAGMRDREGRLWFPTQDGVVMVDPARLPVPLPPPPVLVERIIGGGVAAARDGAGAQLGVNQRDVQIEYTAPSFLEPGNLRFRYRLEPYDDAWVDAGTRRTAYYTRLPPGRYTFRVMASRQEGVWSEAAAAVPLTLVPQPWETGVFRLSLLALFLVFAAATLRWRDMQLRRRAWRLERVVDERTAALRDREQQLASQNTLLEAQAGQLRELDHAKSNFFANVSHELRTPLTLTIGPLEDLRTRSGSDPVASRSVDMALRNARRLLRLVNQILDLARLEAGRMTLRTRPLDLGPLLRGMVAAFASVAEQRGILLTLDAPPSLRGAFDSDALEKVLTNLLSNAIKFTPRGGCVELALSETDGSAVLRIGDTGPGIPAPHLPHVFERFYQVDETNARAQPGTGIGLALVRELVELHGGTIDVDSPAGSGAVFTVVLPLVDASSEAEDGTPGLATDAIEDFGHDSHDDDAEEGYAAPDGAGEDTPTLLVVDDSADMRTYIRRHFEPRFRVIEAGDGVQAIALARDQLPDLLVCDVMMPGTDGYEVCAALRASPDTDFIPVILLTAQASTEQRIAGLGRGADDYLIKPFEMRELEARIDNLVAARRRLLARAPGADAPRPGLLVGDGVAPGDRAFLDRLQAAVDAGFSSPDFGVAELAAAVFQDRSHLFRRTRQLLGESPSDLIRRVRLEHATRLLAERSGTVADVAYAVGFSSVSYFCRCFQQAHGTTPAAWRAQLTRT